MTKNLELGQFGGKVSVNDFNLNICIEGVYYKKIELLEQLEQQVQSLMQN